MPFVEYLSERARKATVSSLREIGRRGVVTWRQIVGERVQRNGSDVLRSEPGDPPFRDSSDFYNSLTYEVTEGPKRAELRVFSKHARKFNWLEGGTTNMEPRPSAKLVRQAMGNVKDLAKQMIIERLARQTTNDAGGGEVSIEP